MPMREALLIGSVAALMLLGSEANAQSTRAPGTVGLNAAETRLLIAQRDRLASQYGLSRRLIDAIATEAGNALGRSNARITDAQLLTAVEGMARRAQALGQENRRLRAEVARLNDPMLRNPALALLNQAESALEEGRLADAERLYGQLAALRWEESGDAFDTWISAVRAQASAAELQGSEEAFERASELTRQARRLARQQQERSAALESTLAIEDVERWLREGENLGRRRGLERAIAAFEEDLAEQVARDPLAERWISAHLAYVRAQSLLAEREGGTLGEARLTLAMLHLIVASRDENHAAGDTARLPLQLQRAFIQIVFDRFGMMSEEQIFAFLTSDMSVHLQRSLGQVVYENSINVSDGFSDEELESLNLILRSLAPFLRRNDIADYLERAGGQAEATRLRNLGGVVAIATSAMTVALSGNATVQQLIDPRADPQRWMENALLVADSYAFEAQSGTSAVLFQRMGLADRRQVAWQGILLAIRAGELASERNNMPILARARHLVGQLTLLMAMHSSGTEQETLLVHSRTNFMAARALRPVLEQPLAWADSTIGLGQLYLYLSRHQPANECAHLTAASDLLTEGLRIVVERRPAYTWQSVRNDQEQIALQFAQRCEAVLGAGQSATAGQDSTAEAAGEAAAAAGEAAAASPEVAEGQARFVEPLPPQP